MANFEYKLDEHVAVLTGRCLEDLDECVHNPQKLRTFVGELGYSLRACADRE